MADDLWPMTGVVRTWVTLSMILGYVLCFKGKGKELGKSG
jgi:hypothetical protein